MGRYNQECKCDCQCGSYPKCACIEDYFNDCEVRCVACHDGFHLVDDPQLERTEYEGFRKVIIKGNE